MVVPVSTLGPWTNILKVRNPATAGRPVDAGKACLATGGVAAVGGVGAVGGSPAAFNFRAIANRSCAFSGTIFFTTGSAKASMLRLIASLTVTIHLRLVLMVSLHAASSYCFVWMGLL